MLPDAWVSHHITGRTRLRIPSQRRDVSWFSHLERELRDVEGVEEVFTNPITGSVLLLHRSTPEELGEAARALGLFELQEPGAEPVLSDRLAELVGGRYSVADRWFIGTSHGRVDLQSVVFLGLASAAVFQMVRGRALPAGVSLLNYALKLLPEAQGRR